MMKYVKRFNKYGYLYILYNMDAKQLQVVTSEINQVKTVSDVCTLLLKHFEAQKPIDETGLTMFKSYAIILFNYFPNKEKK